MLGNVSGRRRVAGRALVALESPLSALFGKCCCFVRALAGDAVVHGREKSSLFVQVPDGFLPLDLMRNNVGSIFGWSDRTPSVLLAFYVAPRIAGDDGLRRRSHFLLCSTSRAWANDLFRNKLLPYNFCDMVTDGLSAYMFQLRAGPFRRVVVVSGGARNAAVHGASSFEVSPSSASDGHTICLVVLRIARSCMRLAA
jgi:hypothetical protein